MKTPRWVVTSVKANPDYTLDITFADGTRKKYDTYPLLQKTIYADLKNLSLFLSAKAERGTVAWNDDIDIAPENLYEKGKPIKEMQFD